MLRRRFKIALQKRKTRQTLLHCRLRNDLNAAELLHFFKRGVRFVVLSEFDERVAEHLIRITSARFDFDQFFGVVARRQNRASRI